jgi:hypothetical protein
MNGSRAHRTRVPATVVTGPDAIVSLSGKEFVSFLNHRGRSDPADFGFPFGYGTTAFVTVPLVMWKLVPSDAVALPAR